MHLPDRDMDARLPEDPRQSGAAVQYSKFSLRYVLEIFFRRKRQITIPVLLVTALAAAGSRMMPKVYESGTTILLGRDEVLNPLVRWQTAVSLSAFDYLMSFQKIIYSRTLLEQVIADTELLPENPDPAELDDMLNKLRGSIVTNVSGADSFAIITRWDDPAMAKEITQTVSDLFIEMSLEDGRKEANTAVQFIQGQLQQYKTVLYNAENALRIYKENNPDKLPDQMNSYVADLIGMQKKLAETRSKIKQLELREKLYRDRLSGEAPMVVKSATFLNASPLSMQLEEQSLRVARLEKQMTEEHPDLIAARRDLAAMIELREKEKNSNEAAQTEEIRSPVYQEVQASLQEARIELETEKLVHDELVTAIAELDAKVRLIPRSELFLNTKQREVKTLNELYETLRIKVEHARVSQNIELQSQENRFKVLDPPRVPLEHSSPNATMILIGGFVGGVFLGLGLILLFEFLDQAIVREEELVFNFGENVLASVPKLHS